MMLKKRVLQAFYWGMFVLFLPSASGAMPVAVKNADALYPVPGQETVLHLALPPSEYVITDLEGKTRERGRTTEVGDSGFSEARFTLPRGWYQLSFPSTKAAVGVVVTPDSPRVGYWNIDAGLTWSKWPPERKQQVIDVLRRKGIATFRERMSWPQAEADQFHGVTRAVRDALYHGDALELFQDSPAAFRRGDRKNSFFVDFSQTAAGIRRMESEFKPAWNAVELWNEPFFNKALPADQYLPVAKLLSAVLEAPVCGGSFAPSISHAYLTGCLESGFADILDAFSLHFYGSPESMVEVISYYRDQLKAVGREAMPLWVTESGAPDITLGGAIMTAMRAIECRTLGVERFYAFYLQQHREGKIDWGMTDASGAPRLALACYLTAASLIGNKAYCGDVEVLGDVSLVRCFADRMGSVLVLYGKKGAELTLPVVPDALAGADGRELSTTGKTFRNVDGLGYAFYAPGRLDSVLKRNSVNGKLFRVAGTVGQRRKPTVVLQLPYPEGQVLAHSNNGYTITPEAAEHFSGAVICNNLTETPVSGTLALELPDGKRQTQEIFLPAGGETTAKFKADFRGALERDGECILRFTFTGDAGQDRIVQRFQRPATVRAERISYTDGNAVDWKSATIFRDTIVRSDTVKYDPPPEEFGSTGQFLWSDIGIHFRVIVRDPRHEPAPDDGSSWMYDSLQIAVSQYNSVNDKNRFEWGFWRDAAGNAHKTTFITSAGKPLSDASEIAIRRDEAAHITAYEGVIAWNDLGSMNAVYNREGMRMRLTFCVNDGNNGNRRWSEWTPGIAQEKNSDSFVELTLVTGEREEAEIPLEKGTYRGDAKNCIRSDGGLKLNDAKNGVLEFRIPSVRLNVPVTLRFELAATGWREHNGTGFSFGAALHDSNTNEAYCLYVAPHPLYGGKTGYMLREKEEPSPVLGMEKQFFQPSGLFHVLEFSVNFGARKFELAVTSPKGGREVVASGPIRRNTMQAFDRITFTTSGWGAGPFLLRNISVIR